MNVSAVERRRPRTAALPRVPSTSSTVVRQPAARLRQHLRALVEADDRAALAREQLARDRAGPGRDVEHGVAGAAVDARDEETPPARILAEREQRRVAVVRRPERGEQRSARRRPLPQGESMLARWR